MDVTELGIETEIRPVQLLNIPLLMEVMQSGILTEVRPLHPLKT